MADFNFSCPHCQQALDCDQSLAGQELQCPGCQGMLVVPQPPAAPPPSQSRLKVNVTHAPKQSAPPASAAASQPAAAPKPYSGPGARSQSGPAKWGKRAIITVILSAAFAGLAWLGISWQAKVSKIKPEDGDGGEIGHIAGLYDVLDRTDPEHPGMSSAEAKEAAKQEAEFKAALEKEKAERSQAGTLPLDQLPVVPAVWSLDVSEAVIAQSRPNGMISGTEFLADAVRLLKVNGVPVLNLRQGTNAVADREILVYLRLAPGEGLAEKSWEISRDMKGKAVPQVTKRWKKNPKYAPAQKVFSAGYAMKLEFGKANGGVLPGKIFLSLPDPEETVIAGVFGVEISPPREMLPGGDDY